MIIYSEFHPSTDEFLKDIINMRWIVVVLFL